MNIENFSLASKLVALAKEKNITIGSAESCTGGNISKCITDVAGSSSIFMGAVISYDPKVKIDVLKVKKETIEILNVVSSETAKEMAMGLKNLLKVDFSISTTGIAGPSGGDDEHPVGLVFIGVGLKNGEYKTYECFFVGDREQIRERATKKALEILIEEIEKI